MLLQMRRRIWPSTSKIEATAEEIAQELIHFREEMMVNDDQVKDEEFLNELALDCATKTKLLIAEVEEALDHLYLMWSGGISSSSSFRFQLPSLDCNDLLEYVLSTLSPIPQTVGFHLNLLWLSAVLRWLRLRIWWGAFAAVSSLVKMDIFEMRCFSY